MTFWPARGLSAQVAKYAAVAAPAAGASIVALSAPLAAGLWQITVETHMWGSLGGSVDNNNMQLSGVPGGPYTLNADAGTGTVVCTTTYPAFQMTGSTTPAVTAIGAASTGTTYSCLIIAVQL